ncbi:MAG: amino acid permease [Gemmataceae bacterium]
MSDRDETIARDIETLRRLGYAQELARRMSQFSNFAISFSIICILAGCVTSFHLGFCSVGGAAIGLGWPLVCCFSLIVALTMGHVASAFPTAGGIYHWASILGGKGWGWAAAWFNLAGLITVLAAINVGTFEFIAGALAPELREWEIIVVLAITLSQAGFNHLGIRLTSILTDFSGYWILVVATLLTVCLLIYAPSFEPVRLITFANYSGLPDSASAVWPATANLPLLFALGFLLPAYTVTGFDASAHTSEETIGAAENVPRGIVRSVVVSGLAGWVMLCSFVLAMPDMDEAARQGSNVFYWMMNEVLPGGLARALFVSIAIAQYLCGLATVTSASRMVYAFARDRGLPFSTQLSRVSERFRTPAHAIWTVAAAAVLFTVYTPIYSTITVVCVIFLYISYALPTTLGLFAYGRSWTRLGPWHIGSWYKPLCVISVLFCLLLVVLGMQPPNEKAVLVVAVMVLVLLVVWTTMGRHYFPGPPEGVLQIHDDDALRASSSSSAQQPRT